MMIRVNNTKLFLTLLVALIGLAWLGLWVREESPHGRYLDHEQLSEVTSEDTVLLVFFVAGWTLMVFAMMLPTSLPLIAMFHKMTQSRRDHVGLVSLLVAGYLGAWMTFGVLVHVSDLFLHEGAERVVWLKDNTWVIGSATLAVAGVYQFTSLKYHCLDKCRSPFSFISEHWRGRHEHLQALRLGVHHGIFCVGCCWSLMLLMFAVGAGNIGWMLALGMVMAVEKNMPWGRRLGKPLGVLLLVFSGVVVLVSGFNLGPG